MTEQKAYICAGNRTAIGRYAGMLSGTRPDDMAAHSIRELVAALPENLHDEIDDVILGCANQAGEDNRNVARMASLLSGLPETIPGVTINRLCGSGLDALLIASRAIKSRAADIIIAGGVESMSRAPFVVPKQAKAFDRHAQIFDTTIGWRFKNPKLEKNYGVDSMPTTAETVATEFGISRQTQDEFALSSQQKAQAAIQRGRFKQEITPILIQKKKAEPILFEQDEHPRQTSLEKLASLPPIVTDTGTVTAGNSSGVNDGACVLLLLSEKAVLRSGLKPIAEVVSGAVAGVPPRIMGIGPVPATRKVLARAGLNITDIDIIELNEAFAAQSIACLRELSLSPKADYINPNGGAIALGHPLGMSGARLALTASLELTQSSSDIALCAMCIGVGQGISVILKRANS